MAAPAARLTRFRLGDDEYATLSVPAPQAQKAAPLTPAERVVVALLLEGKTNPQIARARKTSVRTVANQVASIFKKLSVGSRAELIARGGAGR
ncbi:MAG: response regulator transcription factor [Myxococcaceae bacterium]|nr:response regulator transcription factor [Myxococcaceae bacterium]